MGNNYIEGKWTSETIRKFWNYFGQRKDLYPEYFSFQVGKGIYNFLKESKRVGTDSKVLDFGCGPGFLLEYFLNSGTGCYGFDFSDKSVEFVNSKFKGLKNWNGAISSTDLPISYEDDSFDLITCIETLEHLLDEMIPSTLEELSRLLKPGGIVLFTTPNEEMLHLNNFFCPFCDTEFHKVQHVRAFSRHKLKDLLISSGFRVVFCNSLDFNDFQKPFPTWKRANCALILEFCIIYLTKIIDLIFPRPFSQRRFITTRISSRGPHLCAIAERVG